MRESESKQHQGAHTFPPRHRDTSGSKPLSVLGARVHLVFGASLRSLCHSIRVKDASPPADALRFLRRFQLTLRDLPLAQARGGAAVTLLAAAAVRKNPSILPALPVQEAGRQIDGPGSP